MRLLCRRSHRNCLSYLFHRRVGCARSPRTWAGPPRAAQRWRPLSFDACVPCVLVDISPPRRHPGKRPVIAHAPWKSDAFSCLSSLCDGSRRRPFPHNGVVAPEKTWIAVIAVSVALVGCLARLLDIHPGRRWPAALVFAFHGAHDAPDAAVSRPPPARHLEY